MHPRHWEQHRSERTGWVRAAVSDASEGIVSTARLVLGVTAAQAIHWNVLIARVAFWGALTFGLTAGVGTLYGILV